MSPNWKTFSDPHFELTFKFPEPTPADYPVEYQARLVGEARRGHLTAKGSRELYFEITRYPHLRAIEHYRELAAEGQTRSDELWVGELAEGKVAGQPAFTFAFRWRGIERLVVLIEKRPDLYRLLYDPHAPLNTEILATVAFLPEA